MCKIVRKFQYILRDSHVFSSQPDGSDFQTMADVGPEFQAAAKQVERTHGFQRLRQFIGPAVRRRSALKTGIGFCRRIEPFSGASAPPPWVFSGPSRRDK